VFLTLINVLIVFWASIKNVSYVWLLFWFLVKRLNNYLKSQLLVQVQALKTKDSELSVTKSELKSAKADVKMQI